MDDIHYSAEIEAHTMRAIFRIARWVGVTFGFALFISGLYEYITTQDKSGAIMGVFSVGSLYIWITITGISMIAFFLTPVVRNRMPSYRLMLLHDDILHVLENVENSIYLPSDQADATALREKLEALDIPVPLAPDVHDWSQYLSAMLAYAKTGNIKKARHYNET